MRRFELVITQGTVVTHEQVVVADIGISDGKIQALQAGLASEGDQEIDASGLNIFPGVIDSHVHFNDPGRAHWEGFASGSLAVAAGGGALFFDMPLNSHPPTLDGESFDQKLRAGQSSSYVDFGLWGGLVPGNIDRLEELAERGVVGFKAFMCNSGMEDFPWADEKTLRVGMQRSALLGRPVAVHAESQKLTHELTQRKLAAGTVGIRDFLASRPIEAELEAIQKALELAGETGCSLHVVHVSCGTGLMLIASARKQGVRVTCETCPHYLVLTEDNLLELGAVAKCAPPLRAAPDQKALWQYLRNGDIDVVSSDHSPAPPEMKANSNFFKVWGGISGVQHTLPLLVTEGHLNREINLSQVVQLLSFNAANLFGLLPLKGLLAVGAEANIALVDLKQEFQVGQQELLFRHQNTPYLHHRLTGKVVQTILRGQTVFKDGKAVGPPRGRFVRPMTAPAGTMQRT